MFTFSLASCKLPKFGKQCPVTGQKYEQFTKNRNALRPCVLAQFQLENR